MYLLNTAHQDTITVKNIEGSYFVDEKNHVYFVMNNFTSSGFFVPVKGKENNVIKIEVYNTGSSASIEQHKIPITKRGSFQPTYLGFYLPEADRNNFTTFNENYARDKNHVYYRDQIVKKAEPDTFKLLAKTTNKEYAVDNNAVYYKGHIIANANPLTFSVFKDSRYAIDDKYVFFNGVIIEEANPDFFLKVDSYGTWYKDQQHVYLNNIQLKEASAASFIPFGIYAKDNQQVYLYEKKIANADAKTFKVPKGLMGQYHIYAYDQHHVYYFGEVIPGADPGSFQLLSKETPPDKYGYAKDRQNVFFEGKQIKYADPLTFTLAPDEGTMNGPHHDAEDKNYKYFLGKRL